MHVKAISRDWQPDGMTLVAWNVLGLGLGGAGLIGFAAIHGAANGGSVDVSFTELGFFVALVVTLALTFALTVVHEFVHGLAMQRYGATPTYGAGVMGRVVPYFFCTAPGARFTRRQFLVITLAPAVIVSIGCALVVAFVPLGGWLVVPAAIHLGGCVGDFGMAVIAARLAPGTLIEDMKTGMRFHLLD